MKEFEKVYFEIINNTISIYDNYINNIPKCLYESIKLMKKNVIHEMNSNIFPIPKTLLSYYVKEIFESGFYYVNENLMENIIDMTIDSENFDNLQIDIEKLKLTKNKHFLMICLPYNEKKWIAELAEYFKENEIKKIFNQMKDKNGAFGTYHSGFLIIINSNILKSLKDIEEAVEHEFIHMFESINDNKNDNDDLTYNLVSLLGHPSEFKAYVVNLMNRLDKIYDKYCVKQKLKDDNFENRKIFLDNMFSLAKRSPSPQYLSNQIKIHYDDSKLINDNMTFFWSMLHWETKEFKKFKEDIYDHFLKNK